MAKQVIQLGTVVNDGTGDPLRTAFTKTNANFTELYTAVGTIPTNTNQLTNGAGFITASAIPTIPTDISDLTDTESLLGGGSGDSLTNGTQTFSLNEEGNVILSGETGGTNRGLVWDYGAEAGGENSTVRQDQNGLTVRAYTEAGEGIYSAPVNIVTNEGENEKVWTFDGDGFLSLPDGGAITEDIVTDNPTIELTPANPDVTSQKLVIKGGGAYLTEENGIQVYTNNNTWAVTDSATFYVYSSARANETLYWWIVPEEAGVSTTTSGIVELDGNGDGVFNFTVISDEYEFKVRVSPTENEYDPETIGVESVLINPNSDTFDGGYHLHLTTGDLSETSIFLGTDDHNVRTTTNGTIQITTPTEGSNVWEFDTDGNLTFPGSSNGKIGESEPGLVVFSDSNFVVLANANSEGSNSWTFGADGTTTFPNDTIDAGTNEIYIQSSNSVSLAYSALDGNWQAEPAQNQLAGLVASYDGIGITLVRGDDGEEGPQWSNEWLFDKDGAITFPSSSGKINPSVSDGVGLQIEANLDFEIKVNQSEGEPAIWSFAGTEITFPDNTVQTTAWTGILPNPTYSGSDEIGEATPAPLNLNNSAEATLLTQLNLINTGGQAGSGSAIDFWTYTSINDVPEVRLGAVDAGNYSADFSIALKGTGDGGNGELTTTWTFGTDGDLTLPGNIQASDDLSITVPSGIPSGVTNWNGQGGWNQGSYTNLATTGGTGTGLTVDVAADGSGYIIIDNITINNPGSGYTNGDVITIDNENNLPGTFTITVAAPSWEFGADGGLTFPDDTVQTTAWTGVASAGTTSTTSANVGYIGMPQNLKSSSYTLVAGDQGKHIYVTAASQTITVPANSTTAFPVGTTIAIIAGPTANPVTIAIASDTMYLGGVGSTGTRTLSAYGMATLVKVAETVWFINGSGLS